MELFYWIADRIPFALTDSQCESLASFCNGVQERWDLLCQVAWYFAPVWIFFAVLTIYYICESVAERRNK